MIPFDAPQRIVIIGGGFSGTLVAIHLLNKNPAVPIDIVEPRALGRGLAYSTSWDDHLLNVPAIRMSAFGSEPAHFLDWLKLHGAPGANAATFAPRRVYGSYIQATLEAAVRKAPQPVRHHITEAASLRWDGFNAEVALANGERLRGARVVLACGNPEPRDLTRGVHASSPWQPGAFSNLDPLSDVLLLGSGLTAVDVILTLRAQGHRGGIHLVSRRGKLPHAHEPYHPLHARFRPTGANGARHLLRAIRNQVDTAAESGVNWRAVVDSLRHVTNDIWSELEPAEQRRLLRHLKVWWDVHRHRMAPEVAAKLDLARRENQLLLHPGRLGRIETLENSLRVTIRLRAGGVRDIHVHRIVNCTGSNDNYRESANALIQFLLERGLATPGNLGRGLRTNASGQVVDSSGRASKWLFTLGPARFGDLFETTAVPELRHQAEALANYLSSIVSEPIEVTPDLYFAMGI